MGFGSYDESEQQQQSADDEDDGEAVSVHEQDHDGQVSFEAEESTDTLIDQLHEIQSEDE